MAASSQRLPAFISRAPFSSSPSAYICRSCSSKFLAPSHPSAASSSLQLRHASSNNNKSNLPWTEKIRRKIWGTDSPPGLADPYGGPSFLEKRKMKRDQRAGAAAARADEQMGMGTEEELRRAEEELESEERERDAQRQLQSPTAAAAAADGPRRDVLREEVIDGKGEVGEGGMRGYTPAKTWHGLIHVGTTGHWEDLEPGVEDEYRPWYDVVDERQDRVAEHTWPSTREATLGVLLQAANEAGLELADGEELLRMKLDFSDPITFQTLKNFTRLTPGSSFVDTKLNALSRRPSSSYADIVDLHIESINTPPSKNLYGKLAVNEKLMRQGNVMVLPRRETPVDREKETGRWKVIEKELRERGLPVLGRVQVQT